MAKNTITMDDLARMIQEGLLRVEEQATANTSELKNAISGVGAKLDAHLEESHKEKTANRFKFTETVSRVEHNQLKVRVETLETKAA